MCLKPMHVKGRIELREDLVSINPHIQDSPDACSPWLRAAGPFGVTALSQAEAGLDHRDLRLRSRLGAAPKSPRAPSSFPCGYVTSPPNRLPA